jgi:hypothetical protein
MARVNLSSAALGMIAALSTIATPAIAADLPLATARSTIAVAPVVDSNDQNAERYRWDRGRYRHRTSVGDVLTGVLILGGIAAVASAASRDNRARDDYRTRDYRPYRGDSRYDDSRGIDNAVRMCVGEIERDARVDSVDGVERTGAGWRVTGSLFDGAGFTCRIGADGRIENVDYGQRSGGYEASAQDNQWDDERYRSAWATVEGAQAQPLPAYPGGPVDGDLTDD